MNNPLVTINILSYNRKEELKFTLSKIFEQDYKNIEVIVVDNASTDGSVDMIKKFYPEVKVIPLAENIGAYAFNKGFEIAKGDYVLILDDDSYPEKETIQIGLNTIMNDEKIAVAGFTIYNSYFNLIENIEEYNKSKGKIIDTLGFIGCGALINKKIFLELGGYEKAIFLYYNELEFSIRAKNAGYRVLFIPEGRVIHLYSIKKRKEHNKQKLYMDKRRYIHTFRSFFIFQFLHFNKKYILKYTTKLFFSKLYVAIKLGYLLEFFQTLLSFPVLIVKIKEKRKPVKSSIQKEYNYGNLKFKDLYVYYTN